MRPSATSSRDAAGATSQSDGGGPLDGHEPRQAPYRLSDLTKQQRWAALLIALLLAAPFVISGVRAVSNDWIPTGDEALIVIKTYDVFSSDPPLVGQPSTSDLYGEGQATFHPGPIEFWLFAVPLRLLGPELAPLIGAGLINGGAVLLAAWVVFRRAGAGMGALAAAVLGAVCWSQGTAVLTDTISSNLGGFSFLLFATAVWALVSGDFRLLPLAVFAGTWTAQQHLSTVAMVLLVAAWGVFGLVVSLVVRARNGERPWPDSRRWILASVILGSVLWAPVLVDQITGDPGNLTAVIEFARDSTRPTLGFGAGIDQALRAIGFPPLFTRSGITGTDMRAPLTPPLAVGALVVGAALLGIIAVARRRRTDLTMLAATALVVAAAGILTGANVPVGLEAERINLYRWVWTAATLAWLAIGWAAGLLALRLADARTSAPARSPRWATQGRLATIVAAPVVLLLGAGAIDASVSDGRDDRRRDASTFVTYRRVSDKLLDAVGDDGPWLMVSDGTMAHLSAGPALAMPLVRNGIEVQVEKQATPGYGKHRQYRPESVKGVILVRSSDEPLEPPGGRAVEVLSLNAEFDGIMERLIETVGDDPTVTVAPEGPALLKKRPGLVQVYMGTLEERLADTPEEVLGQDFFLELVQDGYLTSPQFDAADVARARELIGQHRQVWGDDHFGVWVLTLDEYAEWKAGK